MGGKTQTSTSQSSTTPTNAAGLQSIYNQVQGVAQTPYQPYTGQLTAGVNAEQNQGIAGINAAANTASPYYQQAAQYATASGAPIDANQIARYTNPYTQSVIDATQANFNESNGQQQQQVKGNLALSGALGGSRQAVAQAETARQQQLAQAPVIAGLNQANYTQALQAAQADRSAAGSAAGTFGALGTGAQTAGLQGAGAQINAGTLQQTTDQAALNAQYQQYLQQLAFPYQNAQFYAQYGMPAALAQGSSTSGSQTTPGPSVLGQIAGLGIAAAGTAAKFAADGGRITYAQGGQTPFNFINDVHGYVPTGGNAPQASMPQSSPLQFAKPQQADMTPVTTALNGLPKFGSSSTPDYGQDTNIKIGGYSMPAFGTQGGGSYSNPLSGLTSADYDNDPGAYSVGGLVHAIHHIHRTIKRARGGSVGGSPFAMFADGGVPLPPDRPEGLDRYKAAQRDLRSPPVTVMEDVVGRFSDSKAQSNALRDAIREKAIRDIHNFDDKNGGERHEETYRRTGRYADGGDTTFDDRFGAAFPMASPAVAPVDDQPFRLAGPEAMEAWRKSVGNPAEVADAGSPPIAPQAAPAPANPMRAPALPPQITGPQQEEEPTSAMAYDSTRPMALAPQPTPEASEPEPQRSFLNPFKLSGKGSDALIATGLGMLASRSPFAGVALGEGGLRGLKSYSDATAAEREAADKKITQAQNQKRIDFEAQRIAQSASQFAKTNSLAERKFKADQDKAPEGYRATKDGYEPIPGGPADPEVLKAAADAKGGTGLTGAALDIKARQMINGDYSGLTNIGRGAQAGKTLERISNRAAQLLTEEEGMSAEDAAKHMSGKLQEFKAAGIGKNAGARTAATREENLNLILKATDAAIPAALEASEKLDRTGWVPLNKIIQKGQVIASNPELAEFGMANLQLAEHWARAMNPTGVMRESDRDKALEFLGTATSKDTYRRIVTQLNKQITRERDAIRSTREGTSSPIPGGPAPSESAAPKTASSSDKPKTITQGGYTYTLQPDGSYK